jgi:hypothetical protein
MKKEKVSTMRKNKIIFVILLLVIGSAIFFATNPARIFKKEATGTTAPPTTAVKVAAEEAEEEAADLTAGKSAIPAFDDPKVRIYNSNVTRSSRIFITIGPTDSIVNKNLKVCEVRNGSFKVSTTDNDISSEIIPFSYLIIN